MSSRLVVDVEGLVGHPEATRDFSGVHPVSLRVGETWTIGPMTVEGVVTGTVNGVIADFEVTAPVHMSCSRCLVEWDGVVESVGSQHFSRIPDEDGYAIVDRRIDIAGPATDELAFALPAAPLCRADCKGLCPICGSDLNSDPCDGHGEESDSPFAALKDLFDT
ncbi:MAG TPA: DUF177 domain-containing protein [Acidimicrobiia bacterium]|nr:DUF177 domain-containing protein [Acidimicrobiia bacterium]